MGKSNWVFLNALHVGRTIAPSSCKVWARPLLIVTETLEARTGTLEKIGAMALALREAQVPSLICLAIQAILTAKIAKRVLPELAEL